MPDGRHFVSRARDEASSWRGTYKGPIPTNALANRLGGYVQAYTLYSSVRPFGVTAIVGGWDSEAEVPVDGQVGSGPKSGSGGKVEGAKAGGPGLYMIEPSGLYWVCRSLSGCTGFNLLTVLIGILRCRNWQGPTGRQGRAGEAGSDLGQSFFGRRCERGSPYYLRRP